MKIKTFNQHIKESDSEDDRQLTKDIAKDQALKIREDIMSGLKAGGIPQEALQPTIKEVIEEIIAELKNMI